MTQPRFRKFVVNKTLREARKPPRPLKGKQAAVYLLTFITLGIVGTGLALKAPIRNSVTGEYSPPASPNEIGPYSRARWLLHDAHLAQLTTDLAWYSRCKLTDAATVEQLDQAGFRPFLFVDEKGNEVPVIDEGSPDGPFSFVIAESGIVSRRSFEQTSLLGQSSLKSLEETIPVDPKSRTSVHGQFLPNSPQFAEEYVCYLADVWDSAVARFTAIYRRPPKDLDDLLQGLGLRPNPDCVWPLGDSQRIAVEGGTIDNNIVYWRVTLAGGATRGQARYYDGYDSGFDDPNTPTNIITSSGSSPVVDPGLLNGSKKVMFNLNILRQLLESARRVNVNIHEQG